MSKENAKSSPSGLTPTLKESKKPRGGKRPGAGMPKGHVTQKTIDKIAAREAVRQYVFQRMEGMLAAQAASAEGASQFVYRDDHGRFKVIDDPDELRACIANGKAIRIFTRLPSTPAFTDLMNRAIDKPKEQEIEIKVTTDEGRIARLLAGRKRAKERSRE